jgi:hypothetical protein
MKKLLMGLSLIVALAVTAGIALLFVDFDSPALGRAVLERAGSSTGLEIQAKKFTLNLWRGVVLHDLEVKGVLGEAELETRAARLVLEHRLAPLLTGKVAVAGIRLDSPRVELRERKAAKSSSPSPASRQKPSPKVTPAPAEKSGEAPAEAAGPPLAIEVSEISIENGSLRSVPAEPQAGETALSGLELVLRDLALDPKALSPLFGLSGRGRLRANEVKLPHTKIERLEGEIQLAAARFEVPELSFTTEQGKFRSSLAVDLSRVPLGYTLKLEADPLDTNAVLGATGQGSFGPGRLDFQAEGTGSDSRGLKGKGVLKLEPGTIPSTPVLAGVEKSLGRTALVGARYRATEARFRVEKNRLHLEPFELTTDQAAVRVSGWSDLAGPLGLQLALATPRDGLKIKEVRDEILDALTDERGWVSIPFKVSGTAERPSVTPDAPALMAQARRGAQKVAAQKASEELKSFLGKKLK